MKIIKNNLDTPIYIIGYREDNAFNCFTSDSLSVEIITNPDGSFEEYISSSSKNYILGFYTEEEAKGMMEVIEAFADIFKKYNIGNLYYYGKELQTRRVYIPSNISFYLQGRKIMTNHIIGRSSNFFIFRI